jgi:hypothetical protein
MAIEEFDEWHDATGHEDCFLVCIALLYEDGELDDGIAHLRRSCTESMRMQYRNERLDLVHACKHELVVLYLSRRPRTIAAISLASRCESKRVSASRRKPTCKYHWCRPAA